MCICLYLFHHFLYLIFFFDLSLINSIIINNFYDEFFMDLPIIWEFDSNKSWIYLLIVVLLSSSQWEYSKSKCQIENNTPCVYAICFKRSTMLAYIYHGHSMAYDPILPVRNRD